MPPNIVTADTQVQGSASSLVIFTNHIDDEEARSERPGKRGGIGANGTTSSDCYGNTLCPICDSELPSIMPYPIIRIENEEESNKPGGRKECAETGSELSDHKESDEEGEDIKPVSRPAPTVPAPLTILIALALDGEKSAAAQSMPPPLHMAPLSVSETPSNAIGPSLLAAPSRAASSRTNEQMVGTQVTTFMIRNLPIYVTRDRLITEVDHCGFDGTYDFVHIPQPFDPNRKKSKGNFGFINFTSPSFAEFFIDMWHRRRHFGMDVKQFPLNISPARIQGLEANLAKWDTRRMRRIRNFDWRPFIRREGMRDSRDDTHPQTVSTDPPASLK